MERLDKILSNFGYGSRKDVKKIIKKGMVKVQGSIVKDSGTLIDPEKEEILINGIKLNYKKFIYVMLNKPDGVISATFDNREKTVLDLLPEKYKVREPFPIGRLDKDTVGLLFMTNDGEFNHFLISPKNHVDKVYYAKVKGIVSDDDIMAFKAGVTLEDGYKCMKAALKIASVNNENDISEVYVTIQEGKFHQVKRMFESVGKSVVYLKRISFGGVPLDESLDEGECRELTKEELNTLRSLKYE